MRVLFLAGSFPPEHCGVGDYTRNLASALARSGGTTVAVLTTHCGDDHCDEFEVLRVASKWSLTELPRIAASVRKWRPDIMHIQYPAQGFYSRFLPFILPAVFRLLGVKVVETLHEPYGRRGLLGFSFLVLGAHGLVYVRPNYLELLPAPLAALVRLRRRTFIPNAAAIPVSTLDPRQRDGQRAELLRGPGRLIVFFGFLYPAKGIELVFDIAVRETDTVIIAGAVKVPGYVEVLKEAARLRGWADARVVFPGFLAPASAANLLFAADAVVLPFVQGGGEWNTSIHGALAQGTFVLTTSTEPTGDDPERNLYTAAVGNIAEMRRALSRYAGRRTARQLPGSRWRDIAEAHLLFYRGIAGK